MEPNSKSPRCKHVHELCLISIFAMCGVFARQGIDYLTVVPSDASVASRFLYGSFFSNFVGCFCIGMFGQLTKSDLKTALTTGFCGCLTTFSGWNNQQAVWLASGQFGNDHYSRVVSVTTWVVDLPCLVGAILLGKDCGRFLTKFQPIRIFPYAALGVSFALVLLCSFLAGFAQENCVIWLAPIFGIFGALGRHFMGKNLNGKFGLPVGTFCANICGSIIYSCMFVTELSLRRKSASDWEKTPYFLFLSVIQSGFCSSLTTISSGESSVITKFINSL